MDQGRVQLVNATHDAFNARDLERFLRCWVPDCSYAPAVETAVEGGGAYRGHDGLRTWWERMEDRWIDLRTEIGEVHEIGELALVTGTFEATGRESHVPVEAPLFEVVSFRDELVLSASDFINRDEAAAELGRLGAQDAGG